MTDRDRPLSVDCVLREKRDGEMENLARIDRQADQLFLETDIANIAAIASGPLTPLAEFQSMLDACTTCVAGLRDGDAVGFVAIQPIDDDIYIRLLAVNPAFGRRGIGAALLRHALDHGRRHGAARCVLSTFRQVSFNAPYYQRHGFVELPLQSASERLRHRFEAEIPDGVDAAQRLLMVRNL